MEAVSITNASLAVLSVWVISRVVKLINGLKDVGYLPGLRVPFQPLCIPGVVFPSSKRWNPGLLFTWDWRKDLYKPFNGEIFSVVPFLHGAPTIYTNSMEIGRQVISAGHKTGVFGKTDSMGAAFLFWGPNIVAAERDTWRKHRRVMSPAFNNETYALVWSESLRTYHDMISAEGWHTKQTIDLPSIQRYTFKYTLLIIASCGFGLPFSWSSPPSDSESETSMNIQDAIETITQTNLFAITVPKWTWSLPIPWIQRTRLAYDSMRTFMQKHVALRREDVRERLANEETDGWRKDVFNLLIRASEEGGKISLDDHDLIGNVFALMFAGHETTAHTLAAALGFLSIDQTVQDEVVAQIVEIVGDRDPTFEDYPKLDKVLAAFYEGVRMFPSGVFLIREAKEDTTITYPKTDPSGREENVVLPVAKGTHFIVDMVGVQYNPRYFSEPEVYRPSRWYRKTASADRDDKKTDLQDSEDFTAFSVGPRACIGRKFAATEAVCLLTLLLRDWRVEPLLEKGETAEEWRQRVMQATLLLTMGVKDVPVRFVKR
ncbi:hypothetical protein SERLA73DRAFT_89745 [Serpula lacrymans var. lacrymans S7.3]|uniref:Cytochrome P450 n=1 Tax=Serpula lacrymans var. lacrymans (strain S7.3) TaxID=936435 RepID=F8PXY9_SERL3|nr:hypothetical protein SERLA73DRAFT_89745 [Serpula lacrymans var. lacrymans S7.3]